MSAKQLIIYITKLLETCSPLIAVKKRLAHKNSHIPKHRRIFMRKRTSLNKPLRSAHNSEQRSVITTKIMEIEHSFALSHADQRAEEEARPAENIKHNPKYFSGYCKRFFKTKTQVSPQQDTEGSLSLRMRKQPPRCYY